MDETLLQQLIEVLRRRSGADEAVLAALDGWLRRSHPITRMRINPHRVARDTGHPVEAIVPELLHGVPVGLFDLRWDVHCPHCNMIVTEAGHLSGLSAAFSCPMCYKPFEGDFVTLVEVTFALNRAVEDQGDYFPCSPPPATNPRYRLFLEAMESDRAIEILEAGVYRYFCPVTRSRGTLTVAGEPTEELQTFSIQQLAGTVYEPGELAARPGPLALEVTNQGHPFCGFYVTLDDLPLLAPDDFPPRLSGLDVLHYPDFWELFRHQVLSERERLLITSVTILFTDISGSTYMYEQLGDPLAYNIVRDHFELLFAAIQAQHGTVIKTIGDAVMASFTRSDQAMRAACAVLNALEAYNRARPPAEQIHLKLGLHRGPAILVTMNNQLDYFGSTVNKATRLAEVAHRDEITYSQALHEDEPVQRVLHDAAFAPPRWEPINLKGIEGAQRIYRVAPRLVGE